MDHRTEAMEQAAGFCRLENCEEAIARLERALDKDRRNAEVQFHLGFCYSGGCRAHSLVSPEIALEHFRLALSSCLKGADAGLRSRILGAMGSTYLRSSGLPRGRRAESALECHGMAARLLRERGDRDGWAREQFNLGNAWCETCAEDHPDKWREAIEHYESALEVRTRTRAPERHAAILQNLGTAYRELPTGDRAANIYMSIGCYRRALTIYSSEAFPLKYAALHNNLANAFITLGSLAREGRARHARRALRHLELALGVWTVEKYPRDHAVALFNQGNAHVLNGGSGGAGSLECMKRAADCFGEAARLFEACGQAANAGSARARLREVLSCLPT